MKKRTTGRSGSDITPPGEPTGEPMPEQQCQICGWSGELVETSDETVVVCPICHTPMAVAPPAEQPSSGKNPHAAALGRLGGLKGGQARAAALTPKQRRAIAVGAAKARWKKPRSKS